VQVLAERPVAFGVALALVVHGLGDRGRVDRHPLVHQLDLLRERPNAFDVAVGVTVRGLGDRPRVERDPLVHQLQLFAQDRRLSVDRLLDPFGDVVVARRERVDLLLHAPRELADRLDAVPDVGLHRPGDPRRLLGDQLAVLEDPSADRLDDLLVALGQRLECPRHLPGDLSELGPQGGGVREGRGLAEPVDALGELRLGAAHRVRDQVQGVLEPRAADGERLEPFVRVRDEAPDRLVARELVQDLRADLVLVAAGRAPDLARDLVHQGVRGVPDRRQSLFELPLDRLLVGAHHLLDVLHGVGRDAGGRARGEQAATPRPVAGRERVIRVVHVRALAFRGRRVAFAQV
jgi:hypothetical protein